MAFSDCKKSLLKGVDPSILKKECYKSTKSLGIKKTQVLDFDVRFFSDNRQKILDKLIELKKEFKPDEILTPSRFDIHQDHQTITNEAIRAFKICSILGYELPWNCLKSDFNYFVELSKESVDKKLQALSKYKSQNFRYYFKNDYFLNHLKFRGGLINVNYAEAFEIIRKIERFK